jgi:hypothetical protein
METVREFLESIHPAAPAAALILIVWVLQYLVRRFVPDAWERVANLPFPNGAHRPAVALARKAWQALPSTLLGAFIGALSGSGNATDAVVGALVSLGAPILHEVVKALPVPYVGGKPPAADPVEDSDLS